MNKTHEKRLLLMAELLRERKNERPWIENGNKISRFTMHKYAWSCGTPGCAIGTYAASKRQRTFRLGEYQSTATFRETSLLYGKSGMPISYEQPEVMEHFGLDINEVYELFNSSGCGNAQTPVQAAKYIEKFVERKRKEAARGTSK